MLRMPSQADPRPNYRIEMNRAINPKSDPFTKERITDRILKRRAQFVRSQAAKDPSQRPQQLGDLIRVDAVSGASEVAVYRCNANPPSLYIAYDCPRDSFFDNVNDQEGQKLLLQAQEIIKMLKNSGVYAKASAIYYVSDLRCPMAQRVAQRMSQLNSDKPGGLMVV